MSKVLNPPFVSSQSSQSPTQSVLKPGLVSALAVALVIITFVAFLPALKNGFVSWDDGTNLVDNPYFRGFTWPHLKWMWTNHLLSHYVPLMWMSFGLDYIIWGRGAFGYHLTNVVLHALNSGLFFLLSLALMRRAGLQRALPSRGALLAGAAFAALFFSLHPLRVESVAWVTERRDVLSGFFCLLSLLAYLRASGTDAAQSTQWKWYALCFGCFVLTVLSKEIGVVLPAILLLLDVYPLQRIGGGPGRWFGPAVRSVWLEKLPFLAVALADAAMTLQVGVQHRLLASVHTLGWGSRFAISVYATAFYLWKTLVPTKLSPLYPLAPQNMSLSPQIVVSAAAVLLIIVACIIVWRKLPALPIVFLSYVLALVPVSGMFQAGAQVAADRYTYLSCMGWAVLAGWCFARCWRALDTFLGRAFLATLGSAILLALSWLTHDQISVWRDSDALWTRAVAVQPSVVACNNLASSLFTEGDILGAMDLYRQSLTIEPRNPVAHAGLGGTFLDLHRWDEAVREFRLAVELAPSLAEAHSSLGHALAMQGHLDDAIDQFQQALNLKPDNEGFRKNLERAIAMKQHPEEHRTWRPSQ